MGKLDSYIRIVQCVSLDSPSLIKIYPEIKDAEVEFSALKLCANCFYIFQDNETKLGEFNRNTLYRAVRKTQINVSK